MTLNKIQISKIHKCTKNDKHQKDDYIASESPLEIRLGHSLSDFHTLAITMCSPSDIKDLIYGYLFTENIISHHKEIVEIRTYDNDLGLIVEVVLKKSIDIKSFLNKRQSRIHASCGICGKTDFEDLLTFKYRNFHPSKDNIRPEIICSLPKTLKKNQQAFNQTGGLHASALFDVHGKMLNIKEDIGRHNALDKIIGSALRNELIPLEDHIILLSGRVSFELVHKSLMAGVSTLCAIGAPSSLSIEIAQTNGLNLIGFVNSHGYNQYC